MLTPLKLKLFVTSLIALSTVAIASFASTTSAQVTPAFEGGDILRGFNHTRGGGESDPISADPGNVIEFVFQVSNTTPDTVATSVNVKANLPSTPSNQLVVSASANSSNGASVSDTATVNLVNGSAQSFEFAPGHTRVFSKSCPDSCTVADTITSGGVNVGDLAFNESAQIFFKGLLTNVVVVQPTPAPTPAPTPTPAPPAPTPTPQPQGNQVSCPAGFNQKVEGNNIVCVQNVNTNTNTQGNQTNTQGNQTQTNNQNVTVNNPAAGVGYIGVQPAPQVAGVYYGTKQLPKTGLPLAAWAAGAFLPVGFGLKRFGKGSKGTEDANYMWEEKQFKANS